MFSKALVSLIITLNVSFVIGALFISGIGNTVPDSLIIAWFSFTTAELWQLATIKKAKVRNGTRTINNEPKGQTEDKN